MRLSVCFSILVLVVALAKASPAANPAEKKSSVEDAKLESKKEDLEIEDTGSDKDRAKKSTSFCVDIKPGSFQPLQGSCKDNQQIDQNANIAIRSEPVVQPVQGYNFVQPSYVQPPYMQPYIQSPASIALPQKGAPFLSFQVVQSSPQPTAQPVPSVPLASVERPNSKPDPEEAPMEQLKPEHNEDASEPLPVPQETLTILPVAPSYNEHLFTLPSSSRLVYPQLEQVPLASFLQGSSTPLQCPCQNNMATFSEAAMEPMTVGMLPYSSAVAGSQVMMPHNTKMHIVTHGHGMNPRHHGHSHIHSHINVNAGTPQSFAMPVNGYTTKSLVDTSFASGISLGSYPAIYRTSYVQNDLMQPNKMQKEIDSSAKIEDLQ